MIQMANWKSWESNLYKNTAEPTNLLPLPNLQPVRNKTEFANNYKAEAKLQHSHNGMVNRNSQRYSVIIFHVYAFIDLNAPCNSKIIQLRLNNIKLLLNPVSNISYANTGLYIYTYSNYEAPTVTLVSGVSLIRRLLDSASSCIDTLPRCLINFATLSSSDMVI